MVTINEETNNWETVEEATGVDWADLCAQEQAEKERNPGRYQGTYRITSKKKTELIEGREVFPKFQGVRYDHNFDNDGKHGVGIGGWPLEYNFDNPRHPNYFGNVAVSMNLRTYANLTEAILDKPTISLGIDMFRIPPEPKIEYLPVGARYKEYRVREEIRNQPPRIVEDFYLEDGSKLPQGLKAIDPLNPLLVQHDEIYWRTQVAYFSNILGLTQDEIQTIWHHYNHVIANSHMDGNRGRHAIFRGASVIKFDLYAHMKEKKRTHNIKRKLGEAFLAYMDILFGPERPRKFVVIASYSQ